MGCFSDILLLSLSGQDKSDNFHVVMEIYVCHQVCEASKEATKAIADTLRKRKRTEEGIKRWDHIIEKLFIQQKLTCLILSFYHCVFPTMKSFVLLLQKKDLQIHWIHVEQLRFVKSFLSCFLRPGKIPKSEKVDEIRCNIAINAIGRSAIFLRGQVKKNIERLLKER